MSKLSILPRGELPPLDKRKLIQFAELDLFDDSDEMLETIGMTPLDIRQFREWQKEINKTES